MTKKTFVVTDVRGTAHTIQADEMRNSDGTLILRSGEPKELIAIFAKGRWMGAVTKPEGEDT